MDRQKVQINRTVLARIRGCQDTTQLEGAACTNRCGNRSRCKHKRTPFLIPTQGFDLNQKRQPANLVNEGTTPLVELQISGASVPDDYVNDIFGALARR